MSFSASSSTSSPPPTGLLDRMTAAARLDDATVPPLAVARERARRIATAMGALLRPIARAVGRVLAPVLRTVTPSAWVVLALGALSLSLAGIFGWPEFSYLGWVLLAAIAIACLFLAGRASYGVIIELNPRRVVVGERALGRLLVTNTGSRALPPNRMELPVGTGLAEFQLPAMAPKQEVEELFQVPTQRRAVIDAGPARSVRGDELGLLRRTLQWSDPVELFVHPRTVRLAASAAGLVRDLEGQASNRITNNDLAFHALRPYVAGDDRRYVHWRTSARIGQLMVRQFQETRRSQIILVIPTRRESYAHEDEFELAVSVAASIATQVILDGTELAVVSDRGPWRTRSVISMLDASCRLQFGDTGGFAGVREFVRDHTRRLPAPSVVMTVSGSRTETSVYRSIQTLYGPDTTQMGVRIDAGGQSRIGAMGGMTMLTVGTLDDLPAMLRGIAS